MARTYLYGRNGLFRGTLGDLHATGNLRATLVKPASTYLSENPTTMSGFSDLQQLTAAEGKVLGSVAIALDTTRDRLYLTAADPSWTGLTAAEIVAGLVLYYHVTNFASSIPLIAFPRPVQYTIPVSGEFEWVWGADGVLEA